MTTRIVSIWLTDWALTVWRRHHAAPPDGVPFALIANGAHGLALTAVDGAAKAAGLHPGQRHADARAMVPGLLSAPADPAADREALLRLTHWCRRWTPSVAADGLDGIALEVAGSTHLFGGEAALLTEIRGRLKQLGVTSRLGLADTPGAAWGLARYLGKRSVIVAPGTTREAVAGLPLQALRLDAETLGLASSFGLKRIGDLYAMPRGGLARRFRGADGLGLVKRLDQMLGIEPETLDWLGVTPEYLARAVFAEPVTDSPGVEAVLPRLIDDLAAQLARHGMGALELALTAFRTDGEVARLAVRLGTGSRQPAFWARLFAQKGVEHLDLGFGIDALLLSAETVEPLAAMQPDLDSAELPREPLNELVDRLAARLGEDAVSRPVPRGSWLPERAERWSPALVSARVDPLLRLDRERPLLLLNPAEPIEASLFVVPEGAPERFRWRRIMRRVTRAEGPERLSPEWWRNPAAPKRTRDYYRVEDDTGARYWLFREGLYDWEDGPEFAGRAPTWWLHGLFA